MIYSLFAFNFIKNERTPIFRGLRWLSKIRQQSLDIYKILINITVKSRNYEFRNNDVSKVQKANWWRSSNGVWIEKYRYT